MLREQQTHKYDIVCTDAVSVIHWESKISWEPAFESWLISHLVPVLLSSMYELQLGSFVCLEPDGCWSTQIISLMEEERTFRNTYAKIMGFINSHLFSYRTSEALS